LKYDVISKAPETIYTTDPYNYELVYPQ